MRVLIVDDHHATSEMLSRLLGAAGHEVRASYRGDEAITIAATFEPELALIDIQLTDTTGFAVARQLRKQFGKRIHLVAITGGVATIATFRSPGCLTSTPASQLPRRGSIRRSIPRAMRCVALRGG